MNQQPKNTSPKAAKSISAKFVMSNTDYKKCPQPLKPEYAFIGRSNVGKSSLINMLASKHNLAKTSQVPGKTQLINHFEVNNAWYLVDLPGYGYAKVPKTEREKWDKMIWDYLLNRENLMCVFVLIDVRHEPQTVDIDFQAFITLWQMKSWNMNGFDTRCIIAIDTLKMNVVVVMFVSSTFGVFTKGVFSSACIV